MRRLLAAGVCAVLFAGMSPAALAGKPLQEDLSILIHTRTLTIQGHPLFSPRLLDLFYARHGYGFVWISDARVAALISLLADSSADGFDPAGFHLSQIRSLAARMPLWVQDERERAVADLQLTDALLRYLHHLRFGRLDPVAVNPEYNDRPPIVAEQLVDELDRALAAPDLRAWVAARFSPPFWYRDLRLALRNYADLHYLTEFPPLPAGPRLAVGSRSERVALVRERLQLIEGMELTPPDTTAQSFDPVLRDQLAAFQKRFGLTPNGMVDAPTLELLNHPYDPERLAQILVNLERMRWFYDDLPREYIFVDVNDFTARLIRDDKVVWSTPVIVGAPDTQTLMFRDTMKHVVFNPTWTVPVSIQKTMGRVSGRYFLVDRRTGARLQSGNAGDYKRFQVVQKPGAGNALGRVKFLFPNRHAIYLHDTPGKSLFGRSMRALSHGCVRVQDPLALANLLLADSGWNPQRIDAVVAHGQTRTVSLPVGVPVILYYLTAFADGSGAVWFRPDIYGRDPALREAFRHAPPSPRILFPEVAPPPDAGVNIRLPVPARDPVPAPDTQPEAGVRLSHSEPSTL